MQLYDQRADLDHIEGSLMCYLWLQRDLSDAVLQINSSFKSQVKAEVKELMVILFKFFTLSSVPRGVTGDCAAKISALLSWMKET